MKLASVCLMLTVVCLGDCLAAGMDQSDGPNASRAYSTNPSWILAMEQASPSARYRHTMTYDDARGRVVLFGGYDGSLRGDTWEWDGSAWVREVETL